MSSERRYWEPAPGSRSRLLCLGGGSICEAVMDRLSQDEVRLVVLDIDPGCKVSRRCQRSPSLDRIWDGRGPVLVVGDAIEMAVDMLDRFRIDLLVPSVPGHAMGRLAMAWGGGRLSPRGSTALLDDLNEALSDHGTATMDPENGTTVSTMNTGPVRCPLDCIQEGICPITGQARELDMDEALEDVLGRHSIRGLVIRPVRVGQYGAITHEQLLDLKLLVDGSKTGDVVAVATSCSCHAIMNVFKVC